MKPADSDYPNPCFVWDGGRMELFFATTETLPGKFQSELALTLAGSESIRQLDGDYPVDVGGAKALPRMLGMSHCDLGFGFRCGQRVMHRDASIETGSRSPDP